MITSLIFKKIIEHRWDYFRNIVIHKSYDSHCTLRWWPCGGTIYCFQSLHSWLVFEQLSDDYIMLAQINALYNVLVVALSWVKYFRQRFVISVPADNKSIFGISKMFVTNFSPIITLHFDDNNNDGL